MMVRIPRLYINRHGNFYYRVHNSTVDVRISLRTKDHSEAIQRLTTLQRWIEMPDYDPLSQLIRRSLGLDIDKIQEEIRMAPEMRHFYKALGLPASVLPAFEVGDKLPATILIGDGPAKQATFNIPSPQTSRFVNPTELAFRNLSKLIQDFESYNEGKISKKAERDRRRIWNEFIEANGDLKTNEITKRIAQQLKEHISHLSTSRQKTIVSHMRVLLEYAKEAGEIEINPFAGLKITGTSATSTPTEEFTDEDFVSIFSPNVFPDTLRTSIKSGGYYWAPIILATSGARPNEICQLKVKNVKQHEGIFYLEVTDEDDDQSVKTRSSKRKIPLHNLVIQLGFLSYVEAVKRFYSSENGEEQLFACMTRSETANWSKNLSRDFNERRLPLAFPNGISEGKRLRSLRKTFILRVTGAGAPNPILRTVVGHSDDLGAYDTHIKNYNHAHSISDCKTQVIDKFQANFIEQLILASTQ